MTNKAITDFRSQVIWRKAQSLAVDLITVVKALPHDRAADAIANQLMRSGASIAANIAEGYGRYSQAAYRHHLSIARGSTLETISWLDLLAQSEYVSHENAAALIERCVELRKLVTIRMKSLDENKTYAAKAFREEEAVYEFE